MKSRLNYLRNRLLYYRHAPLLLFAGRIMLFMLGGIGLGMISVWYMIERGSALTTVHVGSWRQWTSSGTIGADPYTLAYMARSGRLPMTATNALYFTASEDENGSTLYGNCDYLVDGKPLDTDWWSLAAYRRDGRPVLNSSHSAFVNSTSVLRQATGGYQVTLAAKARPGNWIETGGHEPVVLMLRLYGIHASKDTQRSTSIEQNLPVIRRLDCR